MMSIAAMDFVEGFILSDRYVNGQHTAAAKASFEITGLLTATNTFASMNLLAFSILT